MRRDIPHHTPLHAVRWMTTLGWGEMVALRAGSYAQCPSRSQTIHRKWSLVMWGDHIMWPFLAGK